MMIGLGGSLALTGQRHDRPADVRGGRPAGRGRRAPRRLPRRTARRRAVPLGSGRAAARDHGVLRRGAGAVARRSGRAAGPGGGPAYPFETRIAGGGAFPHVAGAWVLWAGLVLDDEGRTELDRLATGARAAASRGRCRGRRPALPAARHLARLRHPDEVSDWVRLLDAYDGPAWTVDRLSLVASYLGEGPRGRPRYETVAGVSPGLRLGGPDRVFPARVVGAMA